MANSIGPLTPLDEQLCHQMPDTFGVVASSDPSWTEKICAMAAARDGSLQLGFGLGKYTNRNVMDAYSGVSPGRRADHRTGQSGAGCPTRRDNHRADPVRGGGAASISPVRAGAQ